MIFVLGFLVAGMLALLFLPAFWRRALRLSARRLEMQMPLSMTEIVAERDQLRAEFAVEQRRIEQRSESLSQANAEAKSELGRRATRIASLDTDLASTRAEAAALASALAEVHRTINETQGELAAQAKALYDTTSLLERTRERDFDLDREHRASLRAADEGRAMIAALQTRVSGLELRVEDLRRDLVESGNALRRKAQEAQQLSAERDIIRTELGAVQIKAETAQRQLKAETERSASLGAELGRVRHVHGSAQRQHAQNVAAIAGYESAITGNARMVDEMQARLEGTQERSRALEHQFNQRLDALRQEKAVVDGALEAARNERDKLQQALAAFRGANDKQPSTKPQDADLGLLRAAISDVASEVLRLAATHETRSSAAPSDTALPSRGQTSKSAYADNKRERQPQPSATTARS